MIQTKFKTKVVCQTKLNKYFIYLTVIPKDIADNILEISKGDKLEWYISGHGEVSIKKKHEDKRDNTKHT